MERLSHILPAGDSPEVQEAQRRYNERKLNGLPPVLPDTRAEVSINMSNDDDGIPYYQRHLDQHWPLFKDASLADHTLPKAKAFWDNQIAGQGLYILGPTGTGKTHLLVSLFRWMCNRTPHLDIAIAPWLDMVDGIKRDFGKEGDDRREAYYYSHLSVLLIDDFGKGQRTPWVLETMYSIIETRLRLKKLTYFTSNYPLAEVADWPEGEAIASRIRGMTNELVMLGEDRRL